MRRGVIALGLPAARNAATIRAYSAYARKNAADVGFDFGMGSRPSCLLGMVKFQEVSVEHGVSVA